MDAQLRTLPKDLSGMYERSLSCSTNPRDLKQILVWLAFSSRPLTLQELAEVVTIDFSTSNDMPTYNSDLLFFSTTDILAFCTGFVTFLPSGKGKVSKAKELVVLINLQSTQVRISMIPNPATLKRPGIGKVHSARERHPKNKNICLTFNQAPSS